MSAFIRLGLAWFGVGIRAREMGIRRRTIREIDHLDDISEVEFIRRFRLNRITFKLLCDDLRSLTGLKGTYEHSLELMVLCTLSFLATGSYQRIVGSGHQLVQRTVSRFIHRVVEALSSQAMLKKWIVFPVTREERNRIKVEFHRKFRIPGVIGCIDCTHVSIIRPVRDEHAYFNRKGTHSINVQAICDSNLRIMSVNAKFGGASHDSHIWSMSVIKQYLEDIYRNGEHVWLLGDSGYAQRPWMMTPILNAAAGSREAEYTNRHVRARNCIERCFGVLKLRWRCLLRHRTLNYTPVKAAKIMHAYCVLHNMTLHTQMPIPTDDEIFSSIDEEDNNIPQEDFYIHDNVEEGRAALNNLIRRL